MSLKKRIRWEWEQLKNLRNPRWVKKEMAKQTEYLFDAKHMDITFRYCYSVFAVLLTLVFILFLRQSITEQEWYYYILTALFGFFAGKALYALIKYWRIYRKIN